MKKLQFLIAFVLIANQISAQIQVTLKGKINQPGTEFTVFEKINQSNLIEITNFKIEESGDFLVKFDTDKPKPIIIKERYSRGTEIEFWADKGEVNILKNDKVDENKVVFFGVNLMANNLLFEMKSAEKKNDEYLNKWAYGEKHNAAEENIYKTKHNKLLAQLKLNYKTNIDKKVDAQLDNWIATEIKAFELLCEAQFYNKSEDIKKNGESTGEIVSNKTNVLDAKQTSFIKALKSFPESALLSDYFLKYFELCCAHNADFNYSSTNNYPLYSEILGSIKVSPENANMNYHNNDNNEPYKSAIRIFNSRAIINWVKTNMADKPKFLEYILVKTVNI